LHTYQYIVSDGIIV